MKWNETNYPRIGETVLRTTLPNGLTVAVVPKPLYRKRYAFFTTRYGGMDMRFRLDGVWHDTPAGIAHYLEHKMFEDEDGDVIVVNKPVGLVVHPAAGHPDGTLVNALLYHCGESLSGINGALRPGIVHRIDRDTSGLLIAAKNDYAHQALATQLQDHSLYREYEAVCVGGLREDRGTVDAPIGRHPTDRKKMCVDWKNGRPAVTHWTVLARYPGYTHVQCRLETGRTHQIRVHMAAQGHPVLGDPVYNGLRKGFPELAGQCLHARRLSFQHPRTGERMTLSSPLPAYFQTVLTRCSRLV